MTHRPMHSRVARPIVLASLALSAACAPSKPPLLRCASGELPCPDQLTAFHCESVAPGALPPDIDEIRWMLDGAKVPPKDEPPVSLTARCTGVIDAAGVSMKVEVFEGFEGGYLKIPGKDKLWFETPLETPETKRARVCVDGPLPELDRSRPLECHAVGDSTVDEARVADRITHASSNAHAWLDPPGSPYAWCFVTLADARRVRVDLFAAGEGWFHLPNERRACFKTAPWK